MTERLRVVLDDWADPQNAWTVPLPSLPDTPDLHVVILELADGSFTGVLS